MSSRVAGAGVLLAALVSGLTFAGVFAPGALLVPLVAVLLPVAVIDLLAQRQPRLAPARAGAAFLLAGAVGLVVLSLPSAPWGARGRAVLDGALHGWLPTLQSTFPAHADPPLTAFVALLTLLAGVVGVEWLRRGFPALLTLLPSAAVVGLAQLFAATTGIGAVVLALCYGAAAALVLAAGRRRAEARLTGRGAVDLVALVLPVVLVAGLGAWALTSADPLHAPTYSVHDRYELATVPATAASPLEEIGGRLDRPDVVVFTARTDAPIDRWPQIVLDGFDGAGWSSSAAYRPLGAALPADPGVTVPRRTFRADITLGAGADGPWLPTQFRTVAVDGSRPAVDPATGTLLVPSGATVSAYTLSWQAPQPARDQLIGAAVDPGAPGSVQLDEVPAGVAALTQQALGGARPSFAAALKLESWLRTNYTVATGDALPTGSGTAQLLDFLGRSKRGTSEQFAAAYVLIARTAGIPARLVVGFRQPDPDPSGAYVVRNADAFAWPEVAVAGVGWVPLDPTGGARENAKNTPPTTQATDAARQKSQDGSVDVPQQVPPAPTPPPPAPLRGDASSAGWVAAAAAVLVLLLAWLVGVPAAKGVRRLRRRRAPGAAGVVGAWLDTRDRLRDTGFPARLGMTVRDVARLSPMVLNGTSGELETLARCVDEALWSGRWAGAPQVDALLVDDAWTAATTVRRALRHRPLPARVGAALGWQSLRPPRA